MSYFDWLTLGVTFSSTFITFIVLLKQIHILNKQVQISKEQNSINIFKLRYTAYDKYSKIKEKVLELMSPNHVSSLKYECLRTNNPSVALWIKFLTAYSSFNGVKSIRASLSLLDSENSDQAADHMSRQLGAIAWTEIGECQDMLRQMRLIFIFDDELDILINKIIEELDACLFFAEDFTLPERTYDNLYSILSSISFKICDNRLEKSMQEQLQAS